MSVRIKLCIKILHFIKLEVNWLINLTFKNWKIIKKCGKKNKQKEFNKQKKGSFLSIKALLPNQPLNQVIFLVKATITLSSENHFKNLKII